jgi:hypothetical protein
MTISLITSKERLLPSPRHTSSLVSACKRPASNLDNSVYTDGVKLIPSVKESNLDPTKTRNIIKPTMMLFVIADGTEQTLQEAVPSSHLTLVQRADFLDHLPLKGVPEFKPVMLYRN